MTSDLIGLPVDQLRRMLKEHQAQRPADAFCLDFNDWMARKDRLKFHLELAEAAEAQAWKPADGPARPMAAPKPAEALKGPGFSPRRPTKAQLDHPEPEPAAEAASEPPMPQSAPPISPETRLGQLLTRLAENAKSGTQTAASLTRGAIRRHCEEHGLAVPKEAQIRRDSAPKQYRKSAAKAPATAPKASASPRRKAAQRAVSPGAPRAAQTSAQGAEAPTHLPPALVVWEDGAALVDQLRHLRGLVLSLLPDLEVLTPQEASQASDELDLLQQTLVLGGKLVLRRVQAGA